MFHLEQPLIMGECLKINWSTYEKNIFTLCGADPHANDIQSDC